MGMQARTPTMPPGGMPMPMPPKRNNALLIGGGAVLGIAILLLLLKLSGIFAAPGEAPSAVLIKTTSPAPAALQKIAEAPPEMPADVLAWLKHLERIEHAKKDLIVKQVADMRVFEQMIGALGAGIGEVDPYDQSGSNDSKNPADVTKGKFEDLKPQWEALLTDYESLPPPEECRSIANDYHRALSEVPGMVGDINTVLNQVGSDPSSALGKIHDLQRRSYDSVDKPFAESDAKVQGICDKYRMTKWFNIGDAAQGVFSKF